MVNLTAISDYLPFNYGWPLIGILFLINYKQFLIGDPYFQGYFKNDVTLNKPFVYPLTITFYKILFLTSFLPAVLITISEFWLTDNPQPHCALKLLFGWQLATIFVTFVKHTVGRPRPHFYAANRIKFDADDNQFYQDDRKTISRSPELNLSKSQLVQNSVKRESRFSFFSGHAMCGMFAAIYLIVYIHEKVTIKNLTISLIQFGLLLIGMFPGITQGRTYWHHWSDVITGHVVGAIAAYVTFYYVHV